MYMESQSQGAVIRLYAARSLTTRLCGLLDKYKKFRYNYNYYNGLSYRYLHQIFTAYVFF